ncbi:MAG: hypothetical protein WC614_05300 [bacterium]
MREINHRVHREKIRHLCSPKEFPLKDIIEKIIACAIEVHSALGPGLLARSRIIDKFQCRAFKRWNKEIGFIEEVTEERLIKISVFFRLRRIKFLLWRSHDF